MKNTSKMCKTFSIRFNELLKTKGFDEGKRGDKSKCNEKILDLLHENDEENKGHVNSIINWRTGKQLPSLKNLLKLCEIFGVSLDYLLGWDDCTTKDVQTISDYTGLNENVINRLHFQKQISKQEISPYNKPKLDKNDIYDNALLQAIEYYKTVLNAINYVCERSNLEGLCVDIQKASKSGIEYNKQKELWEKVNKYMPSNPDEKPHQIEKYYKARKTINPIPYTDFIQLEKNKKFLEYTAGETLKELIKSIVEQSQ